MRTKWIAAGLLLGWTSCASPHERQHQYDEALEKLMSASPGRDRFYALGDAAKESFITGEIDAARDYARELLSMAALFPDDWNYGNAVHDGHIVLGRIALKEGRMGEAVRRLIVAGKTPGSPNLETFGPNVSLAEDLLKSGERSAVLEYLDLCRKFWENEDGRLDQWKKEILAGAIPDFGANLVY